MHAPRFSIVTPSFNQGRFIETTIRSVLAQGYDNLEYIICDGGSTDDTMQIIDKYRDRIDIIISEPDGGQSDAINKGFRKATGDIIAWINSDDYYYPYAVRTAAERFMADPQLDIIYGDCAYTDSEGQFLRYFTEVRPYSKSDLLNRSNYIMQPTTFYKRAVAEKLGFLRDELHYTMDWDLWCRFAKADAAFHYEARPLAVNREYGDTKTLGGGGIRQQEIRKIHKEHRTGAIPWASISFAIADRLKKIDRNRAQHGGRGEGGIYPFVRWGKRILRREPMNHLYGLQAYGSKLDAQFRLCFPWYADHHEAIDVTLRATHETEIELSLDNHTTNLHDSIPSRTSRTFTLTLNDRQPFDHLVDIRGQWFGGGSVHLEKVEVR